MNLRKIFIYALSTLVVVALIFFGVKKIKADKDDLRKESEEYISKSYLKEKEDSKKDKAEEEKKAQEEKDKKAKEDKEKNAKESKKIAEAEKLNAQKALEEQANQDEQVQEVEEDPEAEIVYETEEVTERIYYQNEERETANLPAGETSVEAGQEGERLITYRVGYQDGVEVSREKTGETIVREAVNQITYIGTAQEERERRWVVDVPASEKWVDDETKPIYETVTIYKVFDFGTEGDSTSPIQAFDFQNEADAQAKYNDLLNSNHVAKNGSVQVQELVGYEKKLIVTPEQGHWE